MVVKVGKRQISKNIAISLLGNAVPMIAALFSIPVIIEGFGKEEFGILSVAWLFLGYFSILDLGIGRATTKFIIDYQSKGLHSEIRNIIWSSVALLLSLGVVFGAGLFAIANIMATEVFNIPKNLQDISINTIEIIAISTPFVTGVAAARGVLEAQQKFLLINLIKIPASILNYLIPLLVIFFSGDLLMSIGLLAILRILLFFIHLHYCLKDSKKDKLLSFESSKEHIRRMLSFGSWLTISNIVGPIMLYFDRLIIGSLLTLTLLTYYSTPYEVVTKLMVIAGSAAAVLFPVFTSLSSSDDKTNLKNIYTLSLKGMGLLMFPMTFFLSCFSFDILDIWLGSDFATSSTTVMQLLLLGVLFNSISAIPYTAIQALNRPDITAKVHLIELPIYVLLLIFMTKNFGITGVALAWCLRSSFDVFSFFIVYDRLANGCRSKHFKFQLFWIGLNTIIFTLSLFLGTTLIYRLVEFASGMVIFIIVFWFWILNKDEKNTLHKLIYKVI